MNLSLRNRIAFFYIVVTGILTGLIFLTIYGVVSETAFNHLNGDLDAEASEVMKGVVVLNNEFVFANPYEWDEKEHGQIEVNPVFIQIADSTGKIIKKTGNLLNDKLKFVEAKPSNYYFNTYLSGSPTRQLQLPIKNPVGRILGYVIIAMPLEESALVLANLSYVLMIAYPIVLIALFFSSRLIAGSSISPIDKVIKTAAKITKENLDERIELPPHKDEIFLLTSTINELLNRLEDAVLREKQFTADASHELRTPLSVIKGTLEVLIRKPRDVEHYENKIKYCVGEVDRMSNLIEQLLLLARYENGKNNARIGKVKLNGVLQTVVARMNNFFEEKNIALKYNLNDEHFVNADVSMLEIIFENIISNAIKYTPAGKEISVEAYQKNGSTFCVIKDEGLGMTGEQSTKIFDRFYRADESRNSQIGGNGLGLAIVSKLAGLQDISLEVSSKLSEGTTVSVIFPHS